MPVGAGLCAGPFLYLWGLGEEALAGDGGGFAAPAATHFANSGKVGKAPFRGSAPENPAVRPAS